MNYTEYKFFIKWVGNIDYYYYIYLSKVIYNNIKIKNIFLYYK